MGAQCHEDLYFNSIPSDRMEKEAGERRQYLVFPSSWFLFSLYCISEHLVGPLMLFFFWEKLTLVEGMIAPFSKWEKVGQEEIFCISQNLIQSEAHERGNIK